MTKDEFVAEWRNHTVGVIALGTAQFRKVLSQRLDTAVEIGGVVNGLSDTAEQLLGQLYDSVAKSGAPVVVTLSRAEIRLEVFGEIAKSLHGKAVSEIPEALRLLGVPSKNGNA